VNYLQLKEPDPPIPLSTFQATPRDFACKTRARMDSPLYFSGGLFHSLQHGGLSRRSPVCRPIRE